MGTEQCFFLDLDRRVFCLRKSQKIHCVFFLKQNRAEGGRKCGTLHVEPNRLRSKPSGRPMERNPRFSQDSEDLGGFTKFSVFTAA